MVEESKISSESDGVLLMQIFLAQTLHADSDCRRTDDRNRLNFLYIF